MVYMLNRRKNFVLSRIRGTGCRYADLSEIRPVKIRQSFDTCIFFGSIGPEFPSCMRDRSAVPYFIICYHVVCQIAISKKAVGEHMLRSTQGRELRGREMLVLCHGFGVLFVTGISRKSLPEFVVIGELRLGQGDMPSETPDHGRKTVVGSISDTVRCRTRLRKMLVSFRSEVHPKGR